MGTFCSCHKYETVDGTSAWRGDYIAAAAPFCVFSHRRRRGKTEQKQIGGEESLLKGRRRRKGVKGRRADVCVCVGEQRRGGMWRRSEAGKWTLTGPE